jgi:hypothetical protein
MLMPILMLLLLLLLLQVQSTFSFDDWARPEWSANRRDYVTRHELVSPDPLRDTATIPFIRIPYL